MDNCYLFLASDDSLLTHVNKTAGDFIVELPRRYRLDDSWECAISEITFVSEFEQLTDRMYACTDVMDDSYVRGTTLPVLRSIDIDTDTKVDLSFNPLCYIKVQTDELRRIRIFIKDRNLKPSRFKFDRLYCTLHFPQKMGSIEVFDFKNKQWIQYVPDFKKWQRPFEDISQGRVRADHKGRYIVGSGARWRSPTASSDDPRLTMVTPIAQTIEMAKTELKSNDSEVIRGRKRMRYDDTIFKKDI
jgi:hypothetical protein